MSAQGMLTAQRDLALARADLRQEKIIKFFAWFTPIAGLMLIVISVTTGMLGLSAISVATGIIGTASLAGGCLGLAYWLSEGEGMKGVIAAQFKVEQAEDHYNTAIDRALRG